MAGKAGSIRMGGAHVSLSTDDTALKRGLRSAEAKLKSFAANAVKIGGSIAGVGIAVAGAFLPAIKAASDLQETMGKFSVVFGDNSEAMKKWSNDFAKHIGRSKNSVASFLSEAADLFIPIGFDQATAEEMSKDLAKLAIDLASFNNETDEQAFQNLTAALMGSSETVKRYGSIVNETAIKQLAFQEGFDPKNLTEMQKVQLRFKKILQDTTAAQGDAERTAGGYANQVKALKATIEDTKATIGEALLPAMTKLVAKTKENAEGFGEWAEENESTIQTVAKLGAGAIILGGTLVTLGAAANVLSIAVRLLNTDMATLKLTASRLGVSIAFLAIAAAARWAYNESQDVKDLNRELAESIQLQEKLARLKMAGANEDLKDAAEIDDPEKRKKFLQEQLDRLKKELAGKKALIKLSQKNADEHSKGANPSELEKRFIGEDTKTILGGSSIGLVRRVFGNSTTDGFNDEVTEGKKEAKIIEDQIMSVRAAIKDAERAGKRIDAAKAPKIPKIEGPEAGSNPIANLFRGAGKGIQDSGLNALTGRLGNIAEGLKSIPDIIKKGLEDLEPVMQAGIEQADVASKKVEQKQSIETGLSQAQETFLRNQTSGKSAEDIAAAEAKKTAVNTQQTSVGIGQLIDIMRDKPPITAGSFA